MFLFKITMYRCRLFIDGRIYALVIVSPCRRDRVCYPMTFLYQLLAVTRPTHDLSMQLTNRLCSPTHSVSMATLPKAPFPIRIAPFQGMSPSFLLFSSDRHSRRQELHRSRAYIHRKAVTPGDAPRSSMALVRR